MSAGCEWAQETRLLGAIGEIVKAARLGKSGVHHPGPVPVPFHEKGLLAGEGRGGARESRGWA